MVQGIERASQSFQGVGLTNLTLPTREEVAIGRPFVLDDFSGDESRGGPCMRGGRPGGAMVVNRLLHQIVSDERLTRNLGDAEVRVLVEWLVEQTEELIRTTGEVEAASAVGRLCRRARAIACFIRLWSLDQARGAAGQLAATERFAWPMPDADADPCELMQAIVSYESDLFWQTQRSSAAA